MERTEKVSCNLLGPTALGFRHRDDILEVTRLLEGMGIAVNAVAPMGASPADIARLGAAHFNVLLYPETGESAARWAEKTLKQPYTKTVPIGVGATRDFVAEVAALAGVAPVADDSRLRQPWWSASVDSTYPHRQARVPVRRRNPCDRGGPRRARRDGLRGGGHGLLQPRIRPPHARGRQGLRARGARDRRLPRSRGRPFRRSRPS